MTGTRQRHVAATRRSLRGANEALRIELSERLAHRGPADAELGREHRLGWEALAGLQLACDDPPAQRGGDLLVRLRQPIPNSALPAAEAGAFTASSPAPAKRSVSERRPAPALSRSVARKVSVAARSISSVLSSAKTTPYASRASSSVVKSSSRSSRTCSGSRSSGSP